MFEEPNYILILILAIYEYPIAYFKSLSIYLELSDEEINKLKHFLKKIIILSLGNIQ